MRPRKLLVEVLPFSATLLGVTTCIAVSPSPVSSVPSFYERGANAFGVSSVFLLALKMLAMVVFLSVSLAKADVLDRVSEDLIIAIDESGPRPTNIEMVVRQGVIFFYNGTKDSLLTLELDFGKYAMSCFSSSTENLAFKDSKTLASTRPIGPGGFATTCFPSVGSYRYTIFGLEKFPNGLKGLIEVSY